MIPGSGRSTGEGIGYPTQYSWASLVAQLVKNPPAMQETKVSYLGWEDLLEEGKATHSSILAWRIPWTVHQVAKSQTQLSNFHFQITILPSYFSFSLGWFCLLPPTQYYRLPSIIFPAHCLQVVIP